MTNFWYFWYCQKDKVISLCIACGFLILKLVFDKGRGLLVLANFLILPIVLIWLAEKIADYLTFIRWGFFQNRSVQIIKAIGWFVLFIMGIFLSQGFFQK